MECVTTPSYNVPINGKPLVISNVLTRGIKQGDSLDQLY